MDETIFASGRDKMDQVIELVNKDLEEVQTGRAKPDLVSGIKVEAYQGTILEIRELAAISSPDIHSLVISPWDKSVISKIEKAIIKSSLQLNPIVDNDLIRINIPSLTEERRRELVKVVKQKIEAGRAMTRQIRIEMKKDVDNQKDQVGVSEDDIHQMYSRLQKLIDEYNSRLDGMEKTKEKELMEI